MTLIKLDSQIEAPYNAFDNDSKIAGGQVGKLGQDRASLGRPICDKHLPTKYKDYLLY